MSLASTTHAKAVELGKHVLRMTTAAGSGHPSSALSLCHIITELMYRQMRFDPKDPWNPAGDRLVLSLGHAVPIVYAAYADLGGVVGKDRADARELTLDDLSSLRELGSVLDGHPNPAEGFPFFDAATGSLGQGLSVAAGLALAARLDGIEKKIYVIAGDGESREGQVWEAMDFTVDHKLTHVCVIFSCNGHGQASSVSHQQSPEALGAKAAAFGFDVHSIDGHDPEEVHAALSAVGEANKPLAIIARTVKGWGVDSMLGKNFHGKPLTTEQLDQALSELDATGRKLSAAVGDEWSVTLPASAKKGSQATNAAMASFPDALRRVGLDSALQKKALATRVAYGAALVALGDVNPKVVALDGDVSNSTFSNMFAKEHADRFFECKIAEQNMVTAAAGMAAAGKIPFASTFAKFIARAVDQIDLAGISRANIKIVGSHAGVSLGADGPSQMSVSDLAYFRSMTRVDNGRGQVICHVFHPADPVCAYRCVELMAEIDGMCFLRTHRPEARFLYSFAEEFSARGCKQLREGDRLTLVSSGFMLYTVLDAAEQLADQGMECNVFDAYTFPLDAEPILSAARNAGGAILTVEDNYGGGLHSEIAEAAALCGDVRVLGMTVRCIPKSAKSADEVFSYVGVSMTDIIREATTLAAG